MICKDRVVAVTGAGRGLGRAHALEFARQGALVVVNDLGVARDGTGDAAEGPAQDVVREIEALGGRAVASTDDIATDAGAAALVETATGAFGRLDTLVNNAGFLRDRMLITSARTSGTPSCASTSRATSCRSSTPAGTGAPRARPAARWTRG